MATAIREKKYAEQRSSQASSPLRTCYQCHDKLGARAMTNLAHFHLYNWSRPETKQNLLTRVDDDIQFLLLITEFLGSVLDSVTKLLQWVCLHQLFKGRWMLNLSNGDTRQILQLVFTHLHTKLADEMQQPPCQSRRRYPGPLH